MRYDRVLLVGLQYPLGFNRLPNQPPSGLGYVAEELEGRVEYEVIDMALGYTPSDLARRIREFRPDLVAVSMLTYGYRRSYDIFAGIKGDFPNLPIAVGGAHMSTFRRKAMEDCPAIDFGFVMEGEYSFRDLCLGADPAAIPGILFRKDGQIVETPRAEIITDLDAVKFPRYRRFELSRYIVKRMNIVTSRGCPFHCTYCAVEMAMGRRFRARSPESVLAEITYWHERGYRDFGIADDSFCMRPARVHAICSLLESQKLDITLEASNGLRADAVDEPLLRHMYSAGFRTIAFGVEAGTDRVLKVLRKQETIAEIERAIAIACDVGFNVILFFLVGSPTETWDEVQESIALARKYPVSEARFYNIVPFPNTEIFDAVKKHGTFIREPEEYLNSTSFFENDPCFVTPELDLEQRRALLALTAQVTRETRQAALSRRLGHGALGSLAVRVFLSPRFRSLYLGNRYVRAAGEYVKSLTSR